VNLLIVKALAVMANPFMPFSSESIWAQLRMEGTVEEQGWPGIGMPLTAGATLEKPVPQFAKVEVAAASEFQKYAALNLKVGKVLDVQPHPNADKLYLVKADVGREITIVTGLKEHYTADELKNKMLVIVTNLEPAVLRGVKSEGMLLAAEESGRLALLRPERDLPPGTQVASGMEPGQKPISFKEFQKLDMRVGAVVPGDAAALDVGGRNVPCKLDEAEAGKVYAAFIFGDKAMLMHADGVKVVFDRDIHAGAKIR
jgi:methionyl-tRNA synthetase